MTSFPPHPGRDACHQETSAAARSKLLPQIAASFILIIRARRQRLRHRRTFIPFLIKREGATPLVDQAQLPGPDASDPTRAVRV